MLNAEITGRLVTQIAPELATLVWGAWANASSSFRGEDYELAAMFGALVEANAIASSDLIDLGATEYQMSLAMGDPALGKVDSAIVVCRRHAEPGMDEGLSEQGVQAAERLSQLASFDNVRCGPSARTSRTARAWSAGAETDLQLALPPQDVESVVGAHASFDAWQSSQDDRVVAYCRNTVDVIRGLLNKECSTLLITHDGVAQAAVAGLKSETATFRSDPLGYLEGIVIDVDPKGEYTTRRLGAPPMSLFQGPVQRSD